MKQAVIAVVAFVTVSLGAILGGFYTGRTLGLNPEAQSAQPVVVQATVGGKADGRLLYTGGCAGCHGMKGEGSVGPALTGRAWTEVDFRHAVMDGVVGERELAPMMPRFAKTGIAGRTPTDDDLRALLQYIQEQH